VAPVEQTDDELGYRPDQVRPTAAVVSFGNPAPATELPLRRPSGRPLPGLTKDEQIAALARLGVDVVAQGTCQPPDLHVRLDAGRARVPGRGHLNLIRSWHVRSDEPRADWVSWLDVEKLGGYVELWLEGLTPNRTYIFDVAVTGWWRNSNSAFMVASDVGFKANFPVMQTFTVQHLAGVFKPNSTTALVRVEPIQLDGLNFHYADFLS
jgi:hypothetical protein